MTDPIIDTRQLTANQVVTLLSDFFSYRSEDVRTALQDADMAPWIPASLGTRTTVTRCTVNSKKRAYYRVGIINPER